MKEEVLRGMVSSYMTRYKSPWDFQKVQLIKRKESEQWYINFPSAVAQAIEFERGETVEGIIEDKTQLVLRRRARPAAALKTKRQPAAS